MTFLFRSLLLVSKCHLRETHKSQQQSSVSLHKLGFISCPLIERTEGFFCFCMVFFVFCFVLFLLCWVLVAVYRLLQLQNVSFSLVVARGFQSALAQQLQQGGLVAPQHVRSLFPQPGIKAVSPTLEGGLLTTEPLGKSPKEQVNLQQGSANLFHKGSDSKYFRLFRRFGIYYNYPSLTLQLSKTLNI